MQSVILGIRVALFHALASIMIVADALALSLLCVLLGKANGFEYPHKGGKPVFADKDDLEIASWIDEWTNTKNDQAIRDKLDLPPIVVVTGGIYSRMRATVDINKIAKESSCTSKVMENWTKQKYKEKAMASKLTAATYDLQLISMPSISETGLKEDEIKDMYTCVAYCLRANIDENGKATAPNGVEPKITSGITDEGVITEHVKKTWDLFGYLKLPFVAFPLNRPPDDPTVIVEFEKFVDAVFNDKSNAKKRKVVVISYCAGGLYAFRFLQKIGDTVRSKIKAWFTMGAPFGGDAKVVERVLSGGITLPTLEFYTSGQHFLFPVMFPVFQRMSFTGFLSPKKEAFTDTIVTLPGDKKFKADQLDQLYEHAKVDQNVRKHLKLAYEQNNIGEAAGKDLLHGIPVYCIYGGGLQSVSGFTYPFDPTGKFSQLSVFLLPGAVQRTPGDRVATDKSAQLCKTLIKEDDPKKFERRFLVVQDMGAQENDHDAFIQASNAKQIGVYILSAIRKMKW